MSMDRGLKPRNALARHRNVLNRDERLIVLKDTEKWKDEMSVFGLPKVANRKVAVKKEKVEKAADGAEGAAAAPAEGAAAKPGAKPAADAGKK
ncbi:MAG: small basic protein [Phycisphaerae bacterium]|nr:small basic protein [Phycisphaerae bacterium]